MNAERLLKLAEHLRSKKLGHKKFNFKHWNADKDGMQLQTNGCGFSGCAIGECPFVFPRTWRFVEGFPTTDKTTTFEWFKSVRTERNAYEFFDINYVEFNHLFKAGQQCPSLYGGKLLSDDATPTQVASNIRAFVAKKLEAK